ncbi:hypothetical protein BH23VER1_BH23VER1_25660 [soil metagenome]
MSAKASRSLLTRATKDLSLAWYETKNHWKDGKSHEFERTYLKDLPDTVRGAVNVIEELERLLDRIRKDCE